ncbi:hypothetical protein [Halobellus sp. EA9]|uniref:hypothetical protein n=1 Tax=Halobellus sp. EA9 TaxID=3421647 RepID=UPI003EBB0963
MSGVPVAADRPQPGDQPPLQVSTTPVAANNTTVQHERPSDVSEDGNTEALRQWLSSRLLTRLNESAVAISQREYQRGKALLGSEFTSRLEQYVDVAGETNDPTDDQIAERIRDATTQQRSFAEAVETYEETYERYQQARANGNTTAARQYARTLQNQSAQITALNQSLTETYEDLTASGVTVGQTPAAISNVTTTIAAQQAQIQSQTFVETRLRVSVNQTTVSFTDPLRVTGQLTTTNGTPVANQSIEIRIFQRQYTTTTASDGSFAVWYRPVALPVTATTTTIAYAPRPTAPYLGTTTTFPVAVQQVTPSLTPIVQTPSVQYGDTAIVTVRVTVSGQPVPSVPVTATLAGQTVNRTTRRGTVTLKQQIPASLSVGNRSLTLTHAREGLAVAPATTTTSITVTETQTDLTVTATTAAKQIMVRGRLTTTTGNGVSAQPVSLTIGDAVVTATTNETGWFRRTVNATTVTENASMIPITGRFDGQGTNLAPTEATTMASLSQPEVDPGVIDWSLETLTGLLAGILLTVLLAVLMWRRRRASTPMATGGDDLDAPDIASTGATSDAANQWLTLAQDRLTTGPNHHPNRAVTAAYAAIRAAFADQIENADSLTHREFRTACATHLDLEDESALETVIQGYEQTTFAQLDSARADDVVQAAKTLVK